MGILGDAGKGVDGEKQGSKGKSINFVVLDFFLVMEKCLWGIFSHIPIIITNSLLR